MVGPNKEDIKPLIRFQLQRLVDINQNTSATNDLTLKVRRDRTSFVNPHSYPTACCGRTNDQDPLDR